jgi:hypothetical protein
VKTSGGHGDWRLPTIRDIKSLVIFQMAGEYKVSQLLKLSACAPWVVADNLRSWSDTEANLCGGGGQIIDPRSKRAPALCVRER